MLDEMVIIAGMLLSGKISSLFTKKIKSKLAPEVIKKYRFWLVEAAFFVFIFGMSISIILAGVINGKGSETLFPALKCNVIKLVDITFNNIH